MTFGMTLVVTDFFFYHLTFLNWCNLNIMILLLILKENFLKNFVKLALGNSEASYSVTVHSIYVLRGVFAYTLWSAY